LIYNLLIEVLTSNYNNIIKLAFLVNVTNCLATRVGNKGMIFNYFQRALPIFTYQKDSRLNNTKFKNWVSITLQKDAASITDRFALSVQAFAFAIACTTSPIAERIIPSALVHHVPPHL
jgi:hypothetical protein